MHLAKEIDAQIMDSELVRSWGTLVTTTDFKRMMNDIINPYGAKAVIRRERLPKPKVMNISGSFSYFRKGSKKIDLVFYLDHRRKYIQLNTRFLNRVIFLTSQTLQHELIHRDQYKKFKKEFYTKHVPVVYSKRIQKKRKEDIVYLSLREEVDCYAQNIAMEIKYFYPKLDPKTVVQSLENRKLTCYKKYEKTFKGTEWSALKKTLLKKVWAWMPKVSAPPHLTRSGKAIILNP